MNRSIIFTRTELGNELFDSSYGEISGDARRLLALIDGNASVEDILEKIPHSVRLRLDDIFLELLSGEFIAEVRSAGGFASGHADQEGYQKTIQIAPQSKAGKPVSSEVETESKRRIELERELAEVRAQLDASRARQKEVEAVCHRLEQQVVTFEQGKQEEVVEDVQPLSIQFDFGVELHDSLDNLNQLNEALIDQQDILDNTLRLRSFQMLLNGEQSQTESDVGDGKVANSHPQYKKLRGLEFFKGFANAELIHFLTYAKWQQVQAGDTILNEGEVGMPFFVIVSGSVKVNRNAHVLASLGRGEFFGEFAHLSGDEPLRSAQVVAETDCELLAVEPLEVEFSTVQMRLHVVEALLRGQVKRAMLSSQRIDSLLSQLDLPAGHEPF